MSLCCILEVPLLCDEFTCCICSVLSLLHVLFLLVYLYDAAFPLLPHDDAVCCYCHFSRSLWLSRMVVEGVWGYASHRCCSPPSPSGLSPSRRRHPAHPKDSTCSAERAPRSLKPIRATFSRPTAATGAVFTRSLASKLTSQHTSCYQT